MAVDLFKSRPLSILDVTKKPWRLNTKVLNSVLDQVEDRPVVIFSMNGATRTGKSFLLNYFVGFFETPGQPIDHFRWAGGQDRVTVGIDIWSKPYIVKTETNGQEVAVLLMDTQGLFDDKTRDSENALIFTVSSLLSSVMIYNHMGRISEDILQDIHHVSTIARFFPIETPALSNVNCADSKNFCVWSVDQTKASLKMNKLSSLLFLHRDFTLTKNSGKEEYKYGLHSKSSSAAALTRIFGGKNYFEDTFEAVMNSTNVPTENRKSREGITENFENVASYLLPYPGDKMEGKNPTPTEVFSNQVQSLIQNTLKSPEYFVKKTMNGYRVVREREIKDYVERLAMSIEMYSDVIAEKLDPNTSSLEVCAAYIRCMYALDKAASHYAVLLSQFLSQQTERLPINELRTKDAILQKSSEEIFQSIAGTLPVGRGIDLENEFLGENGQLRKMTMRSYTYFIAINNTASEKSKIRGLPFSWAFIFGCVIVVVAIGLEFRRNL